MRSASLFLSYSSKDRELAIRIAEDLQRRRIKVWIDEWEIYVGHPIGHKIGEGLKEADFVAVLLTKHSVKSGWVEKEWQARIGEEVEMKKVVVLPLKAEECEIPILLREKRYANFVADYTTGLGELLEAINAHSGKRNARGLRTPTPVHPERIPKLSIGSIPFPCFFPSISGAAKNTLSPLEHLKVILATKYPHFLISAYDIFSANREERLRIYNLLEKASARGRIVLLDSGLYEKRWLQAKSWPKKNFYEVLRNVACQIAFCYDNTFPKGNPSQIAAELANSVGRDQKQGGIDAVCPLVHAAKPEDFEETCYLVAGLLNPAMIAVPERELGGGVLAIAKNVLKIRSRLDSRGRYYPLHIVGAGNPLSILIYSACGADSFDGLDWCQTVADHKTGRLYHSLQLEFFSGQTPYASDADVPYLPRVLGHNLSFYARWMERVQMAIEGRRIRRIVAEFIPAGASLKIGEIISGVNSISAQEARK